MGKRNKTRHDPSAQETPLQPGDRLRLAREAKSLSIAEVSIRLKLDEGKIGDMERGDVAGLAEPVFAAGYLRTYARLLELAEAEVMEDFAGLLPAPVSNTEAGMIQHGESCGEMAKHRPSQFSLRDKPARVLPWFIALSVLLLGVVAYFWLSEAPQDNPAAQGVVPSRALPAEPRDTVIPRNSKPLMHSTESGVQMDGAEDATTAEVEAPPASEMPLPEPSSSIAAETVEMVQPAPPAAAAPTTTFEALGMGMQSELVLTFNSDSWAEVFDARGERLVYRLGKAGSRRVVMGVAPFSVQLGYVPGVEIRYNGAPYDLSRYAGRRSVRLRIGEAGDRMGGG